MKLWFGIDPQRPDGDIEKWAKRAGNLAEALFSDPQVLKALPGNGTQPLLGQAISLARYCESYSLGVRSQHGKNENLKPSAARKRWQDLATALARVEAVLFPRFLRGDPTLIDIAFKTQDWSASKLFEEISKARLRAEAQAQDIALTQRRGGQADPHRARLARSVAGALRHAGLPVRKSREGLFASVLGVCLEFAGGERPEELWRLVSNALGEVRRIPADI